MTRILLIESIYPLNSRNVRILSSLKRLLGNDADIRFIAWNRDGRTISEEDADMFIFKEMSPYGNSIKKLLNLKHLQRYIRQVNDEFKPDYIIASHWECLLLAARVKQKEQCLIYENLDMPTASYKPILYLLKWLERWSLKRTDGIIQSSRFFIKEYPFFKGKQILIENRPSLALAENKARAEKSENRPGDRLRIAFVGILRYFDVMKNLITAAKELEVDIFFYGDGPDAPDLMEFCKGMHKVYFPGRYNYYDLGIIYDDVDLVWAVYPTIDYNVKYAISNKFFESMVFNKPSVFAKGTLLGDMVSTNKIGFAVNPYDVTEIHNFLKSIVSNRKTLAEISNNISKEGEKAFWEDEEYKLKELLNN